jgi:hypothetical protein
VKGWGNPIAFAEHDVNLNHMRDDHMFSDTNQYHSVVKKQASSLLEGTSKKHALHLSAISLGLVLEFKK